MRSPLSGKPSPRAFDQRSQGHPFGFKEIGFYLLNEGVGTTVYNLASPYLPGTGVGSALPRIGALTNATLNWAGPGHFGQSALKFAGSATYVDLDPAISTKISNYSSGSIVVWLNSSSFAGHQQVNLVNAAASRMGLYILQTSGKVEAFNAGFPVSTDTVDTVAGLSTNTWYQIVWTSDGSIWKIYFNSVLQAVTVAAGTNRGAWWNNMSSAASISTVFGYNANASNYPFVGQIDHIRIYGGRTLTPADIKWMYQEPFADFTQSTSAARNLISSGAFVAHRFELAA